MGWEETLLEDQTRDLDHQSSRIHRGVPNHRVSSSVINYRPKLRGSSSVSVGVGSGASQTRPIVHAHAFKRTQGGQRSLERFMVSQGRGRLIRGPVICRADWELGLGSWL